MSLTRTRAWVAGAVVLCLLLSVASYFLLVGPKRAEASEFDAQTASTVASNAELASRVAELEAQFADLPQRQAELAAVKAALPEGAALPTLVRDLDSLAAAAGVTMTTLTPGAGVVVPTAATNGAVTAAGTAAPADPAAADPAAATDPAASTAVAGTGDLLISIPVSVTIVGDFFQAELFLQKVQTELARAYLITDLALVAETTAAPAAGGKPAVDVGDVTVTLSGSVFAFRSASAAAASVAAPVPPTTVTP